MLNSPHHGLSFVEIFINLAHLFTEPTLLLSVYYPFSLCFVNFCSNIYSCHILGLGLASCSRVFWYTIRLFEISDFLSYKLFFTALAESRESGRVCYCFLLFWGFNVLLLIPNCIILSLKVCVIFEVSLVCLYFYFIVV